MNIEYVKIKELQGYEFNTRTHSDSQVNQLAASIGEFGFTNPLLIDGERQIIAGHGRFAAATKLQMDEVPCIVLDHLSEAQRRAYVIADNKLALNAGWDEDLLKLELSALDKIGFDLSVVGFDEDELSGLVIDEDIAGGLTDEDDVPEVAEIPISKQGDIWLLGEHRVMCGDSTNADDVSLLMDGKKADLLLTDPPYGIGYGGSMKLGQEKHGWKQYRGGWDEERPSNEWIDSSFEITTNQIVWGGNYFTDVLPPRMGWLIWDKGQREFSMADGEMAWTSFDNALRIKTVHRAEALKDGKVHPTQKSIELLMWSIEYNDRNAKKEAKLIMDLFLGSGSTLIASEKKNRKCYGMELDPIYVDVIVKRWQDYTGKIATHAETGVCFNEVADAK